ncbi:MAG: LysE family translocator [Candidatus Binatia bacterium]
MTFSIAFAIGFSVASIPGPIIVLIITETLRVGQRGGLLTMMAPPLVDALVMLPLGLFLQASLFTGRGVVVLGLIGAGFLGWLGLQSIRAGIRKTPMGNEQGSSSADGDRELPCFVKGTLTHLTSPYPYLYWGTVGASFVRRGFESDGFWIALLFPLGFWLGTGAFGLLAIYLVAQGKRHLPPRLEPLLHYVSGILLIGGGIFLAFKVWQGHF